MASQLGGGVTFDVLPQLDQRAVDGIKAKVDDLSKSRSIDMRIAGAKLDTDIKKYQAEFAKLTGDKSVTIKAKADFAVAKLELDKLTADKRTIDIQAKIDKSQLSGISSDFEKAGGDAGKVFNNALKEGGGGEGAGMMSPQVIIPLVGVGLALMPGLFAAAGGIAAVAFGGALAIKGSPALQKAGKSLLTQLTTTMEGAAKVLDQPISQAFKQIQGQLPTIGKLFGQTFADVAPLVKPLVTMLLEIVTNIMPGFNSLMKQASKPLSDFFVAAGKIVGSGLGKFLAGLGPGVKPSLQALQSLLTLTVDLLPPIAQLAVTFAKILGPALNGLVLLINASEKAWARIPAPIKSVIIAVLAIIDPIQQVEKAVGQFQQVWPQLELDALKGLKGIVDGMTDFTGTILHLASDAFGWIPGIGPKLKSASKDFDSWKSSVNNSLQQVIDKTQAQIDKSNAQRAMAALVAHSWDDLSGHINAAAKQQDLTRGETDALTNAMKTNKGNVDNSSSAFETFAGKLGISKSKADDLWASLKRAAGNYAANVRVSVTGGGKVTVNGVVSVSAGTELPGASLPNPAPSKAAAAQDKAAALTHAAAGMHVLRGMGPAGRDSVPIMAAPGEAIVPPQHVAKVSALLKDKGVPGFASGGIIGASSSFSQAPSVGSSLGKIAEPTFAQSVGNSISHQTTTAIAAALKAGLTAAEAAAAAGPMGGPAGGATGSEMANGRELYSYLLANVFGGAKIAAAGAIASIWGESTWNPFAQGTGGRGLIGWTPPGSISDAAFSGGMKSQEPAIVRFITTSGDWGVINEMKSATSILEAANLWGKGVERYGINDVHSTGLSLAAQIMGATPSAPKGGVSTNPIDGSQTFNGYSYGRGGKVFNLGGVIPEKVIGRGLSSGMPYAFGAGERVKPPTTTGSDNARIENLLAGVRADLAAIGQNTGLTANNTRATASGINGAGHGMRR